MTRETLEGLRHGKPHSCGGPELVHLHVSSAFWWPPVVLRPVLLPILAIEVFSIHAADLANSLCIYYVFLDIPPNLNCSSKRHSPLFSAKVSFRMKHQESFKVARFL